MITSGRTTVGLTPTLIDGLEVNPFRIHIHNDDNTDTVYLGNATVSPTTGLALRGNDSIELIMNPLEALYAISTKTGHTLSWLKQTEV